VRFVGICQYDGSNFSGFQSQKNASSVQDVLESAISSVGRLNGRINYAGRTDAGVHATKQIFDFSSNDSREIKQWMNGANSSLPDDVSIKALQEVSDNFHSRYDAISRSYSYLIYIGDTQPIFLRNYVLWEKNQLDVKKTVFVFVNPSVEMVNKIINLMPASILQFHGNETGQFCNQFNHPYWKSIPVKDSSSLNSINNFASAHGVLLETFSSTSYGGTGQVFDWSLLKNLSLEDRFILAGGINQENIKDAISMNPWCIDVNSGVESKLANKDKALMSDILEVFHDG